jgi:cell division protein FtsB
MTIKQKVMLAAALLAMLFTLLLIVFGENGLTDRERLKVGYRQVVSETTAVAHENARLYRQIERLRSDPVYIESIARRELGMIGREEVIVKPLKPIESEDSNQAGQAAGGLSGER